jgi:hypothetical protein
MVQRWSGLLPTDGKKSKEHQLKEAGISTSTANRYEELVGPTVDIGMQAASEYFANAEANNEPVTMTAVVVGNDNRGCSIWLSTDEKSKEQRASNF